MVIPVDKPSFMFGDNQSVLANTSNPGSTIKNKSQSICFHFIHEGCAHDERRTDYVKTCENIAYLLRNIFLAGRSVGTLWTKSFSGWEERSRRDKWHLAWDGIGLKSLSEMKIWAWASLSLQWHTFVLESNSSPSFGDVVGPWAWYFPHFYLMFFCFLISGFHHWRESSF